MLSDGSTIAEEKTGHWKKLSEPYSFDGLNVHLFKGEWQSMKIVSGGKTLMNIARLKNERVFFHRRNVAVAALHTSFIAAIEIGIVHEDGCVSVNTLDCSGHITVKKAR